MPLTNAERQRRYINRLKEKAMTEHDVEQYIDQHGMARLLTMLENICHDKAEHVQSNWQDRVMASAWRRGAARINKVARFEDWPL